MGKNGILKNKAGEQIFPATTADQVAWNDRMNLKQAISEKLGAPYAASTVSSMTDRTRIYVYTGDESGYTKGNWYYWNGSSWVSGGVYNSVAVETDKTLTVAGKAADGEVVGQEIGQLKEELEECIDVTASRNILAFENYTRGKYYSASSGSDRYNDSFTAIDDYVKIEPNTDYVFSIFSDGNYETMPNALVIQYDAGRKYISGADVKTFKTAINARYIRLSMANVYFDKQVMLEKGTEPSKIYESPLIEKNTR